MSKSKVLLQIFPLVTDIDCLERTLVLLKQNSAYFDLLIISFLCKCLLRWGSELALYSA